MFKKSRLSTAILAASTLGAPAAQAAIAEVVVTATKRSASTQDIPVAVQALDQAALNDLGVTDFKDYLIQMPGITAGGSGPGQNQIYIRGVASTTPNLTTAGVAGLAPNVALYLDEQPLAQPGRNLDVYTADMSRVEVLAGPQGTLFGASSQAGTVRLITNKPDPSGTYANVRFGTEYTPDGEPSNNVEGMLNLPVNDRLTVRGVVYTDNQGGWIDNVRGTRDASESARFRPEGTVRSNGVPVSAQRSGFQAGADLSGVTFLEADNGSRTERDFNETTYAGARLSALYDINEDWSVLVTHMRQTLDSEGVFFADPGLDDFEIQRYEDDSIEDGFHNTSWTLDGRVGELEVLYTGAYTDRQTDQVVDYSDYLFVGQYLPYYICDGSVSYPGGAPTGTCQPPNLFVKSTTDTEVQTHEFRITTPQDKRVRATVGLFYSDLELAERNDFTYPGSTNAVSFDGITTGFAPNIPFQTGYRSDEGPFPEGVVFRNDILRTDEQFGAFGEVTFDVTNDLALTLGARYYDIEVDFDGSANGSFFNFGGTTIADDCQAFGTDISDLYNGDGQFTFRGVCQPDQTTYTTEDSVADIVASGRTEAQAQQIFNAVRAPDTASTSGVIGKATLTWRPTDTSLLYATWSEGFRPGFLNRPGGAVSGTGYTVPFELDTDEVVNYELGWKLDLLDRTLRFNGSLFRVEIDDLQTTIFDPSITNLFFSDNAANAEVTGLEGDFIWTPPAVDGLTVTGAFSILDTEITDVLIPTDDVRAGDELAYAPQFQGNLRARYQWSLGNGMTAHVTPILSYSAESFSDVIVINRDEIGSWALVDLRAGIANGNWTAELYAENLFDEKAELQRNYVNDRERVIYARPQTFGLRVSFDF
ncbi:MAG: TonB-dependent receptor [Pseudomonadales bacterium]|jgi:outer membrane receptor protein involved in Fe transport|nr:TonB-dependent receptor [Pseudomonadales bacterium]